MTKAPSTRAARRPDDDRVPSLLWEPGGRLTPFSFGVPKVLVEPLIKRTPLACSTAVMKLPPHPGWEWRKTTIPHVARRK